MNIGLATVRARVSADPTCPEGTRWTWEVVTAFNTAGDPSEWRDLNWYDRVDMMALNSLIPPDQQHAPKDAYNR